MGKSLLAILVVAGVVLVVAGPAGAAVFSADFEAPSYTSGPMPSGLAGGLYPDIGTGLHLKPAGQTPNWNTNGWSGDPNEGYDAWPNDAFVVADPSNANNHVAAFIGDSSGGPVRASSAASKMTLPTTGDLVFSQKAYYPSVLNAGEHRELIVSFLQTIGLYFGTSGYFGSGNVCWTFDNGSGWTVKDVTADAWHEAVVTVHQATGTADFAVDGEVVVAGRAVNLSSFTGLAKYNAYSDNTNVDFGKGGNDYGAIFLDNVVITPEPVTMALLAMGSVGMLLRRRR